MPSEWNQKLSRRIRTCRLCARCMMIMTVIATICVAAAWIWPEAWKDALVPLGVVWVALFVGWVATVPTHDHPESE